MTVLRDGNTWLTKLERIKLLSSQNQEFKFNNIEHIIDFTMLEEQFKELSGKKAVGFDGITKEIYGKKLETNLRLLLTKNSPWKIQSKTSKDYHDSKRRWWHKTTCYILL